MTPYHLRAAHDRAWALGLALVDPLFSIVTSLWLALQVRPVIMPLWDHGIGYRIPWVVGFVGIALMFANPMAVVVPLARGFGYPATLFGETKPRYLGFLVGLGLLIGSKMPVVMQWLEGYIVYPNYLGTAALIIVALFAAGRGAFELLKATWIGGNAWAGHASVQSTNRHRATDLAGQLVLCGGIATGIFRSLNLAKGAPREGELLLYGEDSARRGNVVIGAPGSSKTRSKIYPDLYWGLRTSMSAGALVFITKRRATDDCLWIARQFRSEDRIHVIGVGKHREKMDVTAGMTPESIGEAIKDGLGSSHSDFWREAPSAFVEPFVELVQALRPATIHVPAAADDEPGGEAYEFELNEMLPTLQRLIALDARRLDAVFSYGFDRAKLLETSNPRDAAKLRDLLHGLKDRIVPLMRRDARLGEELHQSVLPQLQPFARGELRDAFCNRSGIDLALLERGHVILVEIDETEYPRAVATVIRMIFRRIVQMARERTTNRRGALNPIVLIADEYANYAASGHLDAWNTIRESNFVPTVGITSISALAEKVGGQNVANAMVGNFANKFFFDSDDQQTRSLARELVGKTPIVRYGTSESTSKTRGTSSSAAATSGAHQSSGTTQGTSTSEHLEDVLDGNLWRHLRAGRLSATAIAFLRGQDGIVTDIVTFGALDPAEGIGTALPEEYVAS